LPEKHKQKYRNIRNISNTLRKKANTIKLTSNDLKSKTKKSESQEKHLFFYV